MRLSALLSSLTLLCAAVAAAPPAEADGGTGGTAPSYLGNTLIVETTAPVVANQVMTVRMSGHADWGGPAGVAASDYSLSLYVQNAALDPHCAHSYGSQLQKTINLPVNASVGVSGWVVHDNLYVKPSPPSQTLDWAGETVPFAIRPGIPNVVLCAFQRYVIDDVAWYELPLTVAQPGAETPPPATTPPTGCDPAAVNAAQAKVARLKKELRKAKNVGGPQVEKAKKRLTKARTRLKGVKAACG